MKTCFAYNSYFKFSFKNYSFYQHRNFARNSNEENIIKRRQEQLDKITKWTDINLLTIKYIKNLIMFYHKTKIKNEKMNVTQI